MIANVMCVQARAWLVMNVTAQNTRKKIGKIFIIHTTRTINVVSNFEIIELVKVL